eukprot:827278-Rhodomonas_salina.9
MAALCYGAARKSAPAEINCRICPDRYGPTEELRQQMEAEKDGAIGLRACYAMSGTEQGYGATRLAKLQRGRLRLTKKGTVLAALADPFVLCNVWYQPSLCRSVPSRTGIAYDPSPRPTYALR